MDDSSLLVPADGEEVQERKDGGRSRWLVEQGTRDRALRLKEHGRRSVGGRAEAASSVGMGWGRRMICGL